MKRITRSVALGLAFFVSAVGAQNAPTSRFAVDAGHSLRVGMIRFSPDARFMASFDYSGKIIVRELPGGAPVSELRSGEGIISMGGRRLNGGIDFSPDGRWLALGSTDDETGIGSVKLFAVGDFREVSTTPAHGMTPQEPRALSGLRFTPDGRLITISMDDPARGGKTVAKAWRVGPASLLPVALESVSQYFTVTQYGARLKDESDDRPEAAKNARDTCVRTRGGGVAVTREGILSWDTGGALGTGSSFRFPESAGISMWCTEGRVGAWILAFDKHPNGEIWLSDKRLYRWFAGEAEPRLVSHIGPQSLDAGAVVPGSDDLMADVGRSLTRYRAAGDAPVSRMPSSGGRIERLEATADGNGLLLDAVYSYFLGGEYTPETYPQSSRLLDLRSGRQADASGDADCRRFGPVVEECDPFNGSYAYPLRKVRVLGTATTLTVPSALASQGVGLADVAAWSDDGQRLIGRIRRKVGTREDTVYLWHDRVTGRTVELAWPIPDSRTESQPRSFLSPRLDIASVELDADGKPASRAARVHVYRLPDRQRLAEWAVPDGATDNIQAVNTGDNLIVVRRNYSEKGLWELFVRRLDGSIVAQHRMPDGFDGGQVVVDTQGAQIWALMATAPGKATLLRWPLRGDAALAPIALAPVGVAQSVAALGARGMAVGTSDGVVHLLDREGREYARYFAFPDAQWLLMLPSGYFMASAQNVAARIYHVDAQGRRNRLDALEERFYRPDLVQLALSGKPLPANLATVDAVKPAPSVVLVDTPTQVTGDSVDLQLRLTDRGGGVGAVRVFLNGTAVAQTDARDLGIAATAAAQLRRVPVRLVGGDNEIRVLAFNADGSMSSTPAIANIRSIQDNRRKPTLHALVVGIDQFENPKLQLNFSVLDASAVASVLEARSKGLFDKVQVKLLVTKATTSRAQLLQALASYRNVAPDDVFLFFVASHGTVEGDDLNTKEYFLIPSNVGSLSERALRRDAISQTELKEAISNIPAAKKAIFLDTCHAGAFGDPVAVSTRGMAEEAAMKVLSRSVGSSILTASTSQQQALEGHNGHGLFSFVLLEGLSGKADSRGNGFVNTGDLANYVEDEVPLLAAKYNRKQFPTRFLDGQSFPLVLSR